MIDFKIRFKSKISHLSKEGILANIHTSSPILKSSNNTSKKQVKIILQFKNLKFQAI